MHLHRRLLYVAVLTLATAAAAHATTTTVPRHTVINNIGAFPLDMSVGYGSVWVNDHRGGTLYRISPKNKVRSLVIGESLCNFPAIGGGRVWVWGCDSNKTYEIDPERMKVVGHRKGIVPVYGAGSLWTLDASGNVLRIDPKSGVVLATIKVDTTNGGPDVVAGGSVWVSSDTSVTRINVKTNKVSAVIPLPSAQPSGDKPNGYLYANFGTLAYGTFWDSNAAGLYAINPTTNVAKRLSVKIRPLSQAGDAPVVAGAGGVWVRTSNKTIARIDPKTAKLIRNYPASAAGGGGGIAVAFRSLWVANAGAGNVWRFRLR